MESYIPFYPCFQRLVEVLQRDPEFLGNVYIPIFDEEQAKVDFQ